MFRKLFFLMTFVVLLGFIITPAIATTYYVDQDHTNADDDNAGTSESAPWETLLKACNTVDAGDTVYVKAGTYIDTVNNSQKKFQILNNGTAANLITFISSPPRAAVVRSESLPSSRDSYAWGLASGSEYIIIDGFKIEGGIIAAYDGASHITIRNCEVLYGRCPSTDPSLNWGITLYWSDYCTVENNYVHDITSSDYTGRNAAGIMVFGDPDPTPPRDYCEYNIIQGNTVDVGYNVRSCYGMKAGHIDNNTWRYNIAMNATAGFHSVGSTGEVDISSYNHYYQNIAIDCISNFESGHSVDQCYFYNNTAVDCDHFFGASMITVTDIELWNNIQVGTDDIAIRWSGYPTAEPFTSLIAFSNYNCFYNFNEFAYREKSPSLHYYTLGDWQSATGYDMDTITSNPLLVGGGDYHLQGSSPCINAGVDLQDYDDDQNTTESINMGAYITGNETIGHDWGASAPTKATSPNPADSAASVSTTADLSWNAGSGATSHDVYFGTDSTPDSGEFQGNQTATTFDPGTMSNSTTYYWRIDEVNSNGTTTGDVWSFTTTSGSAPGAASSPSPSNSATSVSITADLSWTAGSGATSRNVYFGTSSPGTSQGNQTATTFDTGTMDANTTYYWRIDEVNSAGTTTGTVWSFTTQSAGGGTILLVDFGGTEAENAFGLAGWNTVIKDIYTDYRAIGPGGTTIAGGSNEEYDYQGVTGTSRSFVVDEKIVVTWYNNSGSQITFTPKISFTDSDRPDESWYDMSQAVISSYGTGTSEFTVDGDSDGNYSVVNVNVNYTNTEVAICDKIELVTSAATPEQATSPSPADSATDVAIDADLSWTAGSGATSRDVYFGTTSPGASQGNQAATTFDTGTMTNNTTYYWRIDEVNSAGTTTGTVWSFTTEAAPTDDVGIIGSWVSGTSHTEEAGTDRALIFIAHAESSADTSDLGSVTYGGQSMTMVVERNMHSSYSAYTCAFILDEAGIDAATSSTFSPSWNTSPSGTPAYTSVFLENVNQTTLTGATGTGGTTTTTAETSTLSTNDGDMAIVAGTCGNDAAYSTINSFTEAIEVVPSSADGIGGYLACTGTNVTPGVSHTNVNRQSVIGFVVKAGTGGSAPGAASSPSPTNSATGVSVTADLSWSAGSGATSHDVYFGTSSPGSFQGNQTATTFDTGTMNNNTTYYWRIDEVNAATTTTGTVWSFTTIVAAPGQASSPSPADSAADVSITADLSWSAGSGATSHDVYFGTSSPGSFQGNQTATTFDTGTMTNNTTYYWRIDEVNAAATTTGSVWSFTTIVAAPGAASSPSPSNSATGVSITADLSWNAGSGATSHDVYFGTTSPGTSQGNQTAATFEPGTMSNDTTYYWRIDEVNAGGTTTGTVWSFTTEQEATPDANLVGWWRFENNADDSAGTNDGTIYGAVSATGKIGQALSFDEVNDYVTVPDFDYTNDSDEFSLNFWFKIADVAGSAYQYIYSHGTVTSDNSLNVYFSETDEGAGGEELRTWITLGDSTDWYSVSDPDYVDGQWHLYTITVSSVDGATIYVDANSILTDPNIKGASMNPTSSVYIGARNDLNVDRYYGNSSTDDGLLDDVRLYDRALSPTEISTLFDR